MTLPLLTAALLIAVASTTSPDAGSETGVLAYRILGPEGAPVPARLTVLEPDVDLVALGGPFGDRHAVREDVCYALDGTGEVVLPAGRCELLASRGIEWSIDRRWVDIPAHGRLEVELRIRPAVDTTGLIGGDFHLHTLTHSGHGDSNMPERIVSLVGEGVDFAIATDHNRNIDYIPTIAALGATSQITSVVGNELSTPIGHFNIFPVDPARRPIPARLAAAPPMFRMIRLEPNDLGVVPVIQVNHPRWAGIDYFSQVELDETTGTSSNPRWSADFDAIEVLNENALWGWRDPADADGIDVGSQTHSSMLDWYALLDTGHRAIATGNSDSHSVKANFAGVPRNYMGSSTDDPGGIDPREMIAAIRSGDVVVSSGPIVRASIPDRGLHEDPRMASVDAEGRVRIALEIQAAPWIDVDRIRVILDGDEIDRIPVDQSRDRTRFEGDIEVPLATDGWIVLLVEGDDSLAPVVDGKKRPVIPVAIINPFRIDADLDAAWMPPLERVKRRIATISADQVASEWKLASGAERRRIIAAARADDELDPEVRRRLIESGLTDESDQWRVVRLGAVRAATGAPAFAEQLERLMTDEAADDRLAAAALRGLAATSPDRAAVRLQEFIDRRGVTPLRDLGDSGLNEVAGPGPRAWMVAGPYPATEDLEGFARTFSLLKDPPETAGGTIGWERKRTRPNGLLSFLEIAADPAATENSIAIASGWIMAPDDTTAIVAFGSDDGAAVIVNGRTILLDRTTHGASPFGSMLEVPLRRGPNAVTIAVENGSGDFGFHFRTLDRRLEVMTSIDD
ncbi:MAG: hypothetical protein CMJ27_04870 [Phycisphaerae bacterium]|nr:hypothetical protein [Phycisphaerae bacterium]OUX02243.1 MAG: hypothetical protein CBD91_02980 [Phycisphaeraceae bacterium TMED231]